MTGPLTSQTLKIGSLGLDCRDLWNGFVADSPHNSPYLSYDFAKIVSRVGCGDVHVHVVKRNGQTVGFLPFHLKSRALRSASKLCHHMSDYCGFALQPGLVLGIGDVLAGSDIEAFHFDHLPVDLGLKDRALFRIDSGCSIPIGSDSEKYFEELKAGNNDFFKKIVRAKKQIERDLGAFRFEWQAVDPKGSLEHLIKLKQDQYQSSSVSDALAPEWTRRLLHDLLGQDENVCSGIISTLHAGSTWIASHYGLKSRTILHSWFPVYNRSLGKYSPGHLLMFEMIARATAEGIVTVDLGLGESDYKKKYRGDTYDLQAGVWRAPGMRGFLDKACTSARWRLDAARARLVSSAPK